MIARRFSGPRLGEIAVTLGVIVGSVVVLLVLNQEAIELKWVAFILAGLFWAVISVVSGSVKKSIFVIFVMGLQAYVALHFGDDSQYMKKSVGQSGPGGFILVLVSIPAFCLLVMHGLERLSSRNLPSFCWGQAMGYTALLVMATSGMTILYSPERARVVYGLFEFSQFFLVFLVVVNLVTSRQDIDRVIRLLMIVLCLQCLVYFLQTGLGVTFSVAGDVADRGDWFGRHGGTVSSRPAPFASFIMPLLHIAISRYLLADHRGTRFWMALLSMMGGAALVLTFTRAAWAGFALGLVWLVFMGLKHRLIRPARLIVVGAVVVLSVLVMLPQVLERLRADHESDLGERLRLMSMAWNVVEANPILGVGAGAYGYVFRDYLTAEQLDREEGWVYIVHNVYLLRWAETGLFGLLSLVLVFVVGLQQAIAAFKRVPDKNWAALALGCSAGIVSLMWEMWWDVSLGFAANAMIWFLFGLMIALRRVELEAPLVAPTPRRPWTHLEWSGTR